MLRILQGMGSVIIFLLEGQGCENIRKMLKKKVENLLRKKNLGRLQQELSTPWEEVSYDLGFSRKN